MATGAAGGGALGPGTSAGIAVGAVAAAALLATAALVWRNRWRVAAGGGAAGGDDGAGGGGGRDFDASRGDGRPQPAAARANGGLAAGGPAVAAGSLLYAPLELANYEAKRQQGPPVVVATAETGFGTRGPGLTPDTQSEPTNLASPPSARRGARPVVSSARGVSMDADAAPGVFAVRLARR